MSAFDVFLILGCIAVGYWVVRSVLSEGLVLPDDSATAEPPAQRRTGQKMTRRGISPTRYHETPLNAWYLVLDVQPDASAVEIGEAVKRRLAHAESAGDTAAMTQILAAARQGLKSPRRAAEPARVAEPAPRSRK